jgi:DNA (cytosine-5)-methyltransferase 3A
MVTVLSLFDGISCARVALDRAGIPVKTYYASEVDKFAIAVSTKNYPDIVRLGDVREVKGLTDIDLLIGGSPCQDLSIAKKGRQGLDGDRSGLFWEYVRILHETKPRWFILENVASMPKKDRDIITREMGVEPVMFNASLVSAQSRKRLFWTNISFTMPEDRGILLKDILQPDGEVDERIVVGGKAYCLTANTTETGIRNSVERKHRTLVKVGHIGTSDGQANRVYSPDGKSCTLSANGGGLGAKTGLYQTGGTIRKLTPVECERLQSLPDGYTAGIVMTNRYKCLGNAFNVEVIAHILSHKPK